MTKNDHWAEVIIAKFGEIIDMRVRRLLHPHGATHGPNGADPARIPVEGLSNVTISGRPETGQALTYQRATDPNDDSWTNGAATGGGGGQDMTTYALPGLLSAGTQRMVLRNYTDRTFHFVLLGITIGQPAVGGGFSLSVAGLGSIAAGAGAIEAHTTIDVDWAPNAEATVDITADAGVVFGDVLIHLVRTS